MLDSSLYDCVLDNGEKLFKIQVKSITKDRLKRPKRNGYKITLRHDGLSYKKLNVDYFAIYVEKEAGFYIIANYEQKSLVINNKGKYKNNFDNFAPFY